MTTLSNLSWACRISLLVLFLAFGGFCMIMGWGIRDDSIKAEAVRLGHARWVSDIDGRAEFKWKDRPKVEAVPKSAE